MTSSKRWTRMWEGWQRTGRRWFGIPTRITPDDVEADLWNEYVTPTSYSVTPGKYEEAMLDQYKLYVEMADRISARRSLTNTFFLTLHTAILGAIAAFWKDRPHVVSWLLLVPLAVLLGMCLAWFWSLRSYRQQSSARYAVIGALERKLPSSPTWRAEWKALGEGSDRARYWPVTHLEQWIPCLFAGAYAIGFLVTILSS